MVLLIAAVGAIVLAVVLRTVSSRGPAVATATADAPPSVEVELVGRFIDRSQRFRRSGAIVGVVVMVAALVVVQSVGEGGGTVNLIVLASIGLAGSIGGSILAEGFRVRRPGPRIASLAVRDPARYRDQTADRRERVLLAMAAAGVVGAWVTGEHLGRVIGLGGVVVALALLRAWSLRRVALRPRPVLPAEVEAADDEVRRLASSAGISRPMVTLGALVVSTQWVAVVDSGPNPSGLVAAASITALVGSIVLFAAACWWWWRNRSFGLSAEQLAAVGGARSHLQGWVLAAIGLWFLMATLLILARG